MSDFISYFSQVPKLYQFTCQYYLGGFFFFSTNVSFKVVMVQHRTHMSSYTQWGKDNAKIQWNLTTNMKPILTS